MREIFDFVVQFCLAIKKSYKTDCFITLGVINRCNEHYEVLFIFAKVENKKKRNCFHEYSV